MPSVGRYILGKNRNDLNAQFMSQPYSNKYKNQLKLKSIKHKYNEMEACELCCVLAYYCTVRICVRVCVCIGEAYAIWISPRRH